MDFEDIGGRKTGHLYLLVNPKFNQNVDKISIFFRTKINFSLLLAFTRRIYFDFYFS